MRAAERERLNAHRRRRPGIDRDSALALGRVVAASAAGGLARCARRVGRTATAALAALTAPATHSWCAGHVDLLAQANWSCGQVVLAPMLARQSILCRSQRASKRRGLKPSLLPTGHIRAAPTWRRVNQQRLPLLSLPTHALRAVGQMTAFAVGGVYRDPDSIA